MSDKTKQKKYEVAFESKTYRQIVVTAKTRAEAEEKAWEELEEDTEVSSAWLDGAEVHTVIAEDTILASKTWGLNSKGQLPKGGLN